MIAVLVIAVPLLAALGLAGVARWRIGVWLTAVSGTLVFLLACALPWQNGSVPVPLHVDRLSAHLAMLTGLVAMAAGWSGLTQAPAALAARRLNRRRLRWCHACGQLQLGFTLLAVLALPWLLVWCGLLAASLAAVAGTLSAGGRRALLAARRALLLGGVSLLLALPGILLLAVDADPPVQRLALVLLVLGWSGVAGLAPLFTWTEAVAQAPVLTAALLLPLTLTGLTALLRLHLPGLDVAGPGVAALGVPALGVSPLAALGVPALGVPALGASALGVSALGVSALGVASPGVASLGVAPLGASGLGVSASGVSALGASVPGVPPLDIAAWLLVGIGLATPLLAALGPRPASTRGAIALASTAQAGVVALAFGVGGTAPVTAGLLHLTLLTLTVVALLLTEDLPGRLAALTATAGLAALAALPPFGLFGSACLVDVAVVGRTPWLVLPLVIGQVLTARLLLRHMPLRARTAAGVPAGWVALLPAWLLLALVLGSGVLPAPVLPWFAAMAAGR